MSLEQVLQKLKETYINDFPKKIEFLKNNLENKDKTNLIKIFHQLKGSGRTYGLPEVSLYGKLLEFAIRSDSQSVYFYSQQIINDFQSIYEFRKKQLSFPIEDSEVFIALNQKLNILNP